MSRWLFNFVQSSLIDGWTKGEIQTFLSLEGYNRKTIALYTQCESSNVRVDITNFTEQMRNTLKYEYNRFRSMPDDED